MNQKMQLFLKSIGITDLDKWDLDFDFVGKTDTVPAIALMNIRKTNPWTMEELSYFQAALSNIKYRYEMRFVYTNEVSFENVESLFKEWFFSLYHYRPTIKLSLLDSSSIQAEVAELTQRIDSTILSEFSDCIKWLNYPFTIKIEVKKVEEPQKPTQKQEEREISSIEKLLNEEEPKKEIKIDQPKIEIEEPEEEAQPEEETPNEEIEIQPKSKEEIAWEEEKARIQKEREEASKKVFDEYQASYKIHEKDMAMKNADKLGYDYKYLNSIEEFKSVNSGLVCLSGWIYGDENQKGDCEIKIKPTRRGQMCTFVLADLSSAIDVRGFEMKEADGLSAQDMNELKHNGYYRCYGAVDYDKNTGDKLLRLHRIEKDFYDKLRTDEEEEKRVELHLHTKMSQMDGASDSKQYIKAAMSMGMKALAITDHGVVQAFPEAETYLKELERDGKTPPKLIYGCEFYVFDRPKPVFNKLSPMKLKDAKFCVFDFETTGLSHTYDRPIEFGAVFMEKGMVTKHIDLFINPEMHIPETSSSINNITDEMVKDKPTMKEAIKEIDEFIGGDDVILVSHNAPFDVDFLNMMREAGGRPRVSNPVIDTLALAGILYPESGSLREEKLARKFGVADEGGRRKADDDEEGAGQTYHRADYDSEILSRIWNVLFTKICEDTNNYDITHEELSKLRTTKQEYYRHLKTFHIIALAKNQKGLKSLFKLVSESETTYLAGAYAKSAPMPKLPREMLEENRENLLIGSACFNGFVFEKAMNGTQEDLEKEMEFYDYIEIQPKENYSYLIGTKKITPEILDDILNRIVDTADKMGKKVCATGDVHYANPDDKIIRDIYISAEGLNKSSHPLMRDRHRYPKFPNADQHLRSTREMLDCFADWLGEEKAKEIVVTNTNWVADQIDGGIKILATKLYTPDANLPNSDKLLRDLCYKNLHEIYGVNPDQRIVDRLEKELNGIISNGYSVTYYIAYLLVSHAAEQGYYVGSRGSVGSSFAATMAGITEVNPLPPYYLCPKCKHLEWANDQEEFKNLRSGFDLPPKKCPHCGIEMKKDGQSIPFETFLGFSAEKVPDIDLNFPRDYQSEAHRYTRTILSTKEENEAYERGEFVHSPHVIRAGTIGTAKFKNACGFVRGYFERELGMPTIPPELKPWFKALATRCSGVKRTTGQHPGGIVVIPADMDVFDFTPFQHPADSPDAEWLTTHFEFASMHDSVLKLDELGHLDPMALRELCLLMGYDDKKIAEEIKNIPIDKKVLSLFTSPNALNLKRNPLKFKTGAIAVPEFGTNFVQGLLEDAKPKTFNDLLVISGLSHGTNVWNGNAQDLVVNEGKTLEEVIGCRDDIMNYLISMGMEPGLAFKIMEATRKNKFGGDKSPFIEDMRKCNVPEWYIESCKKIQYLFPRAHATAYVIAALRVAYFKVYHPLEFYAVFFTTRCEKFDIPAISGSFDDLLTTIRKMQARRLENPDAFSDVDEAVLETCTVALEMKDRGYEIKNVDIMKSEVSKWVVDRKNNCIYPPFTAISNFSTDAATKIVEARKDGEFISVDDFKKRTGVGASSITMLKELGSLNLSESNQLSLFDFAF